MDNLLYLATMYMQNGGLFFFRTKMLQIASLFLVIYGTVPRQYFRTENIPSFVHLVVHLKSNSNRSCFTLILKMYLFSATIFYQPMRKEEGKIYILYIWMPYIHQFYPYIIVHRACLCVFRTFYRCTIAIKNKARPIIYVMFGTFGACGQKHILLLSPENKNEPKPIFSRVR